MQSSIDGQNRFSRNWFLNSINSLTTNSISKNDLAFSKENFHRTQVPVLLETLIHSVFTGSKRFRSKLMYFSGISIGVDSSRLKPFAIVLERIHEASLLHDDVIDDAHTRRNKPSFNSQYGNARAVLAGDLLLSYAFSDLGKLGKEFGNWEILQELFEVLIQLSEGEWLQLETRFGEAGGEKNLKTIAKLKTGSLMGWATWVPAALANLSNQEQKGWKSFGITLGLAFQMLDDCLDLDLKSGKPPLQDFRKRQLNFVYQDLLEKNGEYFSVLEKLSDDLNDYNELKKRLESVSVEFKKDLIQSIQTIMNKAGFEIQASLLSLPNVKPELQDFISKALANNSLTIKERIQNELLGF